MSKFDAIFGNTTEATELEQTPTVETPSTEEVTEVIETNESEAPEEKETEVVDEKKGEEVENNTEVKKHWRDRYAETDEYKASLRKQDEAQYTAKLKEIEEIENDEAYKIIKTARAQGKNPLEVIKELAVDNLSNLTPKDLFMKDLDKYKGALTEEEITEEIEKFEGKSKLEQIKATEGIKAELTKQREEQLAKFQTPKQETKLDEATQAKVNKFDTDFENRLTALDGKTINGVKFTPAVLKKIEDTIAKGDIPPSMFIDENGNFDADEAIELAVLKHYRQPYLNGLKGQSKSEGIKEALKEKHNVSSGKAKNTGMPDPTDSKAIKKAQIAKIFGN